MSVKDQRCRSQHKRDEAEYRETPAVAEHSEERRCKQRHDAANEGAEDCTCGDGGGGVLLEGVDVVVLRGIEDHDLSDAVKDRAGNRNCPVCMKLNGPGEPVTGQ